jgi:hypothetical protein
LLGFYVIDVSGLDEALDIARDLMAARTGSTYEVRPISLYVPDGRSGQGA